MLTNQLPTIPSEPLVTNHNSTGILPDMGLYLKGSRYHQMSSRSTLWFAGVMCLGALIVWNQSWGSEKASGLQLKQWIAIGMAWGGLCAVAFSWIRNAFGQTIIIDPNERTLEIRKAGSSTMIQWSDIICLQLCHEINRSDPEMNGYQLNLVWREKDGKIHRHCLYKHANRQLVSKLAERYVALFAFELSEW